MTVSQLETLFSYLRTYRTATRAEIAHALGISTVSAGTLADRLLADGFLTQKPKLTDAEGRRSSLLSLHPNTVLPVLDLTGTSFSLRLFSLAGNCVAVRPFLSNGYLTREENMAAFIRTAALFLSRRKDADPFPASVVILPFGYRAANFSDYYSEDFIRHHLHVRMPERAALICSDAEAGARALLERPMPRPQMLVYLRDNRQFAVSADGTFAVDLASYICRGKTLAEWIRTADPAPLAELFLHLSLFGGVSSFLVDAVGFPTGPVREAIRCLAPGTNLILCPMAEDENFYTFGASLLLMRTLLNDRFPSKGDQ